MFVKCFMAHQQTNVPRLFIRSDWEPPIQMIHRGLVICVNEFSQKLNGLFKKKQAQSNLLPFQRQLLAKLRTYKTHVVFQADKNLGPCIIERNNYIQWALGDHLTKADTYSRLSSLQAHYRIHHVKQKLVKFIEKYKNNLLPEDIKFLQRSTKVKDPFAKLYITAKVHKQPWQTRPIVSIDGSLLHGLGRWVDKVL
jgi:hypothetical protein